MMPSPHVRQKDEATLPFLKPFKGPRRSRRSVDGIRSLHHFRFQPERLSIAWMEPSPLRFRTFFLAAQNTLLLLLTSPACHLGSMSLPREACPHSSSRGRVPPPRDGLAPLPHSPTGGRAPPPPGHVGNSRRAGRVSSRPLGAQRSARRTAGTEEASTEGWCPG